MGDAYDTDLTAPLPEIDLDAIAADAAQLGMQADDLCSAYQSLQARYRALLAAYTASQDENERQRAELEAQAEAHRSEASRLRTERNAAVTNLALAKSQLHQIASGSAGVMRTIAKRETEARPQTGAPKRPVDTRSLEERLRSPSTRSAAVS